MAMIHMNGHEYRIMPCTCGSLAIDVDAGMMGCVIRCLNCGLRQIHNGFHECLYAWNRHCAIDKMVFSPEFVNPEDFDVPEAARHIRLTEMGGSEMARRGNTPFERSIQDSVIIELNKDEHTIVRCRSADSVGHIAGDADVAGSIGGVHVEIEVKVPGEKPTKLQHYRLSNWAATGAACCWVTSKDEALAFQKKVLAGRGKGRVLGPRSLSK
jgi:hypothetical protein